VLAGRVIAPPGVKVTVLPGTPAAKTYPTPTVIGFRPGYAYRLELTNLPNRPGAALYPVLEVRGSIVPRPGLKYMEFPAPVYVSQGDIERAFAGEMITKVVYLEDPTRAVPVQTRPDLPIEFTDLNEDDAMKAAAESGRLVAVLRFGDRIPDADELAREAIPGTVLLPGQQHLPAPAAPPLFRCLAVQLYDPIIGAKLPTEECLTDGGDVGPRLGIGPRGRLGGLNPTDVALEYTLGGRRHVVTSNQVCVCSPRFAIRRTQLNAGGVRVTTGPGETDQITGRIVLHLRQPAQAVVSRVKPVAFVTRLRAAIIVGTQGVHSFVGISAPQILASQQGASVLFTVIEPDEITSHPHELIVTKSVEPAGPVQVGDEVTFTIRYWNNTLHPVSDLMLSDSLSGRLEYIDGSAKTDRPANVTTVPNDAGSVILRLEIPGPVPPGQRGEVKFRARVR
jgi:uncharacterized repeat protein (TIGR01451 family)